MTRKIRYLAQLLIVSFSINAQSANKVEESRNLQFKVFTLKEKYLDKNNEFATRFFHEYSDILFLDDSRLISSTKFNISDVEIEIYFYENINNSIKILLESIFVFDVKKRFKEDVDLEYKIYKKNQTNYLDKSYNKVKFIVDSTGGIVIVENRFINKSLLYISETDFSNKINHTISKSGEGDAILAIIPMEDVSKSEKMIADSTFESIPLEFTLNENKSEFLVKKLIEYGVWDNLHLDGIKKVGSLSIEEYKEKFAINNAKLLINNLSKYSQNYSLQRKISEEAIFLLNKIKDDLEKNKLTVEIKTNLKKYYDVQMGIELSLQLKENEITNKRLLKENDKIMLGFQRVFKEYEFKIREFESAKLRAIIEFERAYKRKQNKFEKSIFERNWAFERSKIIPPRNPSYFSLIEKPILNEDYFFKSISKINRETNETETYEPPTDPDDEGFEPVEQSKPPEDEIFTAVEQQAQFPGGPSAWVEFLNRTLKYPLSAQRAKVGGRVFVSFVVNTDGSVQDVDILKGVGFGCDEEAIRIIKSMPLWKPGRQSDRAVRSRYTQPITFVFSE